MYLFIKSFNQNEIKFLLFNLKSYQNCKYTIYIQIKSNLEIKMSDNEFDDDVPQGPKKIESKRIFINHVDTFNGKNLAKVI